VCELETNVHQEKRFQESLNREQKLSTELQNHVGLQSQSVTELEEQQNLIQKQSSYHENQLHQFTYVQPLCCIYFDIFCVDTCVFICS
jgi:hypothetical protein